jgi:hypothetical protein
MGGTASTQVFWLRGSDLLGLLGEMVLPFLFLLRGNGGIGGIILEILEII